MQEKFSKLIANFLQSHPLISAKAVEHNLGLPTFSVRKAKLGMSLIPEQHIFSLVCHLANYGLKINGYELQYDPSSGELSASKIKKLMQVGEEEEVYGYIVKEDQVRFRDYEQLLAFQ